MTLTLWEDPDTDDPDVAGMILTPIMAEYCILMMDNRNKVNDNRQQYIMALDQGTTSSRCIIYDRKGNAIGKAQKEFQQIFPESGWVEHDPMEIWESQLNVTKKALENAGLDADDIAAIGITNQRETTIVWDRATGKPIYNAIVWQCRRTANYCDGLKEKGLEEQWRSKTGLPIDPYFSATKLNWILENVDGARERAKEGELLFGTVDSWLLWNLTGGRVHATDPSNAARTMMFNIEELCWDSDILDTLGIPWSMLPKVMDSSCLFGHTAPDLFGGAIPIGGIAGDQQAALFGQTCFEKGMAKNTFGTGGFLLINTGDRIVRSGSGLLSTIAWKVGDKATYALEGSVFISGAAMQWLRDGLEVLEDASRSEEICNSVKDTAGVYLVPAFAGLGAPYWDPYARGLITGLTRGTTKAHIIRAAVEAMAYQTCDLIEAANADIKGAVGRLLRDRSNDPSVDLSTEWGISELRVDGGAARDNFLLQFQADMLDMDVCRPSCIETTSLGAAYLAGLAVGYWEALDDIVPDWQIDRIFEPEMDRDMRHEKLKHWKEAVDRCKTER